ncbi:hypothetical protein EG832_02485 [bacterium]|nr:hypothetical protein [bacterium]
MIRITTQKEHDVTVVIIDGQMTEEDLPEIIQVRASLNGAVALNLSELTSVPSKGIRLLRDWIDAGARLQDASLFLRMILVEKDNGIYPTQ